MLDKTKCIITGQNFVSGMLKQIIQQKNCMRFDHILNLNTAQRVENKTCSGNDIFDDLRGGLISKTILSLIYLLNPNLRE